MPNILKLTCENPDEILNAGAYGALAVIRLQTAAVEAGPFADVAGTGSTPTTTVVAGTTAYTAYDPAGTSSSWYRTRFENVGATRLSDWSAAFQVAGEEGGLICSLYDVKQALGRPPSDTTADEVLLEHIRRVTAEINGYTRRLFTRSPASGTKTVLFDVRQVSRSLWVPRGIAEMSQLELATQTGGAFTTISASDWFLDPPDSERDFGWPATRITLSDLATSGMSFFSIGKRVVRATMAEGWAAVPADVAGIGERAVIASFLSKGSGAGGVAAIGPSGGTTILRNISPADRATLDWYRAREA